MNKVFLLSLLIVFLYCLEVFFPLRKRQFNRSTFQHGMINIAIIFLGTILVKIVNFTLLYYSIDLFQFKYSLISILGIGGIGASLFTIILFDFLIWFQHLISHHVPFFWRFHRVHHCDDFLDTSSGLRFHPFEIVASLLFKFVLILVIGISQADFLIFEFLLTSFALFNHSNIKLPNSLDRVLSLVIVTPNVHQVHHSKRKSETNSNFGFNIVLWDRIFGTYKDFFKVENLEIGLDEITSQQANSLSFLLLWPLRRK